MIEIVILPTIVIDTIVVTAKRTADAILTTGAAVITKNALVVRVIAAVCLQISSGETEI